ncbi:hypothetical protein GPJ56_000358 [Histomonas meleagridis]|uniref:uncharacterized protein n=1 Tax=Histomonas meleagridis TaxID=135588 RepID=UPI0035594663|nr:hypothetical protein GPJ56_000358 [Histomonas meleagridis]KAH0806375.1 hypothetical protein GO595_000822 [Histomonas meleagridis]
MNSFPEVNALGATSFIDFRDGFGIATLWNLISTQKIDISLLKKPSNQKDSITIMKNLRAIDQVIAPVLTERGIRERVEFTSISFQSNENELIKYVCPLVIVAIASPLKKEIVARIKTLSSQNQKIIKEIIQNYTAKKKAPVATSSQTTAPQQSAQPPKPEKPSNGPTQITEKIDNPEIRIKKLEIEISQYKKQIQDYESKLAEFQGQAKQNSTKVDQAQSDIISQTEQILSEAILYNEKKVKEIEQSKSEKETLEKEYQRLKQTINYLETHSSQDNSESQKKNQYLSSIKLLDESLREYTSFNSQHSSLQSQLDSIKEEINKLSDQITFYKDEITTSILLAEKYGTITANIEITEETDTTETVTELASRISQLEAQLAVLQDGQVNGDDGVPKELAQEQKDLTKIVSNLLKRKKQQESAAEQCKQLRSDLQRVQHMIVDQREEVENELEKLTDDINAKNVEISDWLSFSSSFDSWRNSPTYINELRNKYI